MESLGEDTVTLTLGFLPWVELVRTMRTSRVCRRCCARALEKCPVITLADVSEHLVADWREIGKSLGGRLECWKLNGLAAAAGETTVEICVAASTRLRVLNLPGQFSLSEPLLTRMLEPCGELVKLNLAKCALLGDAAAADIARLCPKLESLFLSACRKLTDESTKSLRTLKNLSKLYINCCNRITDTGAAHLFDRRRSAALPSLRILSLSQTSVTDAGLGLLAKSKCSLKKLVVSHSGGITIAGLQEVMASLPSCDVHNMHGYYSHPR